MNNTSSCPSVSLIIATYNRASSLQATLAALEKQTFPANSFEVVVVDDGSSDNTNIIAAKSWPFKINYLRQSNQGGTKAKNNGASEALGNLLVFLDDDIRVAPDFISVLLDAHTKHDRAIVVGNLFDVPMNANSVYGKIIARSPAAIPTQTDSIKEVSFDKCLGGFFSVKREHFIKLGMLEGVSGWPNWEDVCFGFKAYSAGFKTLIAQNAIGYHHDYAISDLSTAKSRWYRASKVAPELFFEWPGIKPHLEMFQDKIPLVWNQDSPSLIFRKLIRYLASSRWPMTMFEQSASFLEHYYPSPSLLTPLYRWIIGGYIFRGYRDGLRELKTTTEQ